MFEIKGGPRGAVNTGLLLLAVTSVGCQNRSDVSEARLPPRPGDSLPANPDLQDKFLNPLSRSALLPEALSTFLVTGRNFQQEVRVVGEVTTPQGVLDVVETTPFVLTLPASWQHVKLGPVDMDGNPALGAAVNLTWVQGVKGGVRVHEFTVVAGSKPFNRDNPAADLSSAASLERSGTERANPAASNGNSAANSTAPQIVNGVLSAIGMGPPAKDSPTTWAFTSENAEEVRVIGELTVSDRTLKVDQMTPFVIEFPTGLKSASFRPTASGAPAELSVAWLSGTASGIDVSGYMGCNDKVPLKLGRHEEK